jgi:hypothetical protein
MQSTTCGAERLNCGKALNGWDLRLLSAEVADLNALGVDLSLARVVESEVGRLIDLFQQDESAGFSDQAPLPSDEPEEGKS